MEECACHDTGGVNQVQCILLKSFFPINSIYMYQCPSCKKIQIYYTNVSQDTKQSDWDSPWGSGFGALHYTTD